VENVAEYLENHYEDGVTVNKLFISVKMWYSCYHKGTAVFFTNKHRICEIFRGNMTPFTFR